MTYLQALQKQTREGGALIWIQFSQKVTGTFSTYSGPLTWGVLEHGLGGDGLHQLQHEDLG